MSKSFNARRLFFGLVLVGSMAALTSCGTISDAVDEAAKEAEADEKQEAATGEDTDVFEIKIGDCLNDQSAEAEVTEIPKVSCDKPHDSEVYASGESAEPEWPGDEALTAEADKLCESEFAAFVGLSYDESTLTIGSYTPGKESWADGDRQIDCVISGADGQTTGSLKNTAQ